MGKRRVRKELKNARKVVINPESATPWWYDEKTFAPKSRTAQRADSEFFSEFSTESLFSDNLAGTHAATALTDLPAIVDDLRRTP